MIETFDAERQWQRIAPVAETLRELCERAGIPLLVVAVSSVDGNRVAMRTAIAGPSERVPGVLLDFTAGIVSAGQQSCTCGTCDLGGAEKAQA